MGTLSTTWGFPWISHMLGSVRWPIGRTSPQWISNPFGCCCWSSDAKLGFVEELNPERGQASMLAEPMVVSKSLASFGSILRLNTKQPSNYLWKLYSWKNSSCSKPKSTNHSINHLGLMLNSPMSRGIPNVTKFKFGDFFSSQHYIMILLRQSNTMNLPQIEPQWHWAPRNGMIRVYNMSSLSLKGPYNLNSFSDRSPLAARFASRDAVVSICSEKKWKRTSTGPLWPRLRKDGNL